MQVIGSSPIDREENYLLLPECCWGVAIVIPETTSEQSKWWRPRSQGVQRENKRGVAEQCVLITLINSNGLFCLQFSLQQGGWGASLADRLAGWEQFLDSYLSVYWWRREWMMQFETVSSSFLCLCRPFLVYIRGWGREGQHLGSVKTLPPHETKP